MFTVYRAYGPHSTMSYYGYAAGENPKVTFLEGAKRGDTKRADVRLFMANNEDVDAINIEIIDAFTDEVDAWTTRNDLRSMHTDSISAPTLFPGNIAERSMKTSPEKFVGWKLRIKQRNAATARKAWALGLWDNAEMKSVGKHFPREQVMKDLDLLAPMEFAAKYLLVTTVC